MPSSGAWTTRTDAVEQGKRKNPHFDLASFGSRFQDPALQRRVEDSLRKAGME